MTDNTTPAAEPIVRFGIAGWSYDDWKGWFYPDPLRVDRLEYVARYFDLAEINSSFYRPPAARASERWVAKVADRPRFVFTAKLWQRFTHERRQPWSAADADAVRNGLRPLVEAGRFRGLLAQFPWSFGNVRANRDWMERIADEFADLPLFVEVRHSSWDHPATFERLRERGIGFVNIDQPMLRNCLGPSSIVTTDTGYFRAHGRNHEAWFAEGRESHERYDYEYDAAELGDLAGHIRRIAETASETLVVTNNHYRGQAPANALQLQYQLTGEKPVAPRALTDRYPDLRKICIADDADSGAIQPTLF